MSRSITIGNGNLLIGLDQYGQVRDFYFPYAGHVNHVSGASGSYRHRIGVWVDGHLHWLSGPGWNITIPLPKNDESNVIVAVHNELQISLTIEDVVHNEENIFIRGIRLRNLAGVEREIRVFFGQEFRISESQRGDTAFYDPRVHAIVHYKGHNTFLIHATHNGHGFNDYSVGLFGIEGKEGTYADAEDGILSKNPVEHGSVDSVIGVYTKVAPNADAWIHYWIVAADSIRTAHKLHSHVLTENPQRLIVSTQKYWNAWLDKNQKEHPALNERLQLLYRHSLKVMKVHSDRRGGIIASSDTDILNQGRDTYSYVWPRDSALTAYAFSRAEYYDVAERYFTFMAEQLEPGGYLMHKYRVDGVLGSSWHPWVRDGAMELPIQEDETAIVLYTLGKHYERARNLEFVESLYNSFIEPVADFLVGYHDKETDLPLASYDLWEEKYGTSTYTAAVVCGALEVASEFSALLGKRENALKYKKSRERIAHALLTHLYDPNTGTFMKLVRQDAHGVLSYDKTIDMSSIHGITTYGVLSVHDKRVKKAFTIMTEALKVPGEIGGYMRYQGDNYYRVNGEHSPNPWCITTLWVAQYHIHAARTRGELKAAYTLLEWVSERASQSGMLPEQLNPQTGAHLSTTPLVWSHAEFVHTVYEYQKKYRALTE